MARNPISHRWTSQGRDSSGLGRWSWLRFKGKQDSTTRVITAYCPNKTYGPNTVYSQHLEFLHKDPIEAFWTDLAAAIQEWQELGDSIVLMGDWNTEVQHSTALQTWLESLDLVNGLNALHGNKSPATYNGGSETIDAIYVSSNLDITKGGYLAFGALPGDHRGAWIDIPLKSFIGYRPPPILGHEARRLKTDDPAVVSRYNTILDSILTERGLYERLYTLQARVGDNELTPSQEKEFEDIDSLSSEAMLLAEKKCRKLKMGGVKWSPALQKTRDTILVWRLVLRRLKGRKVGARTIIRAKKKAGITESTVVDVKTAEMKLDDAFKEYKVCRAKAESLSLAYRERLAQRRAAKGRTKAATELRNLNQREAQRVTSRRIKKASGKSRGQGTSKIQIETADGGLQDITDPEEMVSHIIVENEEKFHQCTDRCPLLEDTIIQDLGLMGDGPCIDSVLDGSYVCPEGASWATRRWLRHMKVPDHRRRQEIITTLADFRSGWKAVNERTSSGRQHFGHFKAGTQHRRIRWFLFVRSVLPYNRGYSPTRWQQGTDVMLLKKQELFLVTKLRTIVLYEADYNHENKRLGRDSAKMALDQGRVAEEQFCRPGRSAQSNALCKRLVFDYARTKKKAFAFGASDLASCHDRIVHNAASIALQRIGISRRKIKSMFGTVQKLVHKVRTLFGDSRRRFGGKYSKGKHRLPPQGTGQGSGAAPSIWTILSSTIFEILHEDGYSTPFIFSISLGLFRLCGFSYVDDCDLVMSGDCPHSVAEDFQDMLRVWDELMEVTGAALAPDKCWWYLVAFEWNNGRWKMTDPAEDFDLQARDKYGNMIKLKRLARHEAREMVGVYLAPDGNQEDQIKVLKAKAKKWADSISNSNLDYHCTWTALTTSALKSLEYPLPATTISCKEMKEIMWPLLKVALPRSGFVRTFPRAVLYGPVSKQGLGVTDPFIYQYTRHVRDIVQNVWKGNVIGKFLRAEIEAITLEAGISGSLFTSTYDVTWFNTSNSWVVETLNFCRSHKIKFDDGCSHLGPKRDNDVMLMEAFHDQGYDSGEMKQLNRCRLYFGVTNLSDITTGDGTRLMDQTSTLQHLPQSNRYDWPHQQRPPRRELNLWLRAIRHCFAPMHDTLHTPLGSWTVNPQSYFQDWEWFLSDTSELFQRRGNTWRQMQCIETGRRDTRQSTNMYSLSLPNSIRLRSTPTFPLFRTTIRHIEGTALYAQEGYAVNTTHGTSRDFPSTNDGLLACLQSRSDTTWTCQYLKLAASFDTILEYLQTGECLCISDGSMYPRLSMGGMAWCLATKGGYILAEGGGLIPGKPSTQSPYRSECGGLYGIVNFLSAVEQVSSSPPAYSVIIGCDGKTALHKCITQPREYTSTSQQQVDMISRIQDVKTSLHGILFPEHVRGHQDTRSERPLTVAEQLNVRMDSLAKRIVLTQHAQSCLCPYNLPPSTHGVPLISVNDMTISSNIDASLPEEVASNRILEYWAERKHRFDPDHEIEVDWDVMHTMMQGCNRRMKRFIPKWCTSQIGVGTTMRKREARYNNCCPRCHVFIENTTHVLLCKHVGAQKVWRQKIKDLSTWMDSKDTHPQMNTAITSMLLSWYLHGANAEIPTIDDDTDHVLAAFHSQSRMGWKSFMEGILSVKWARIQQKWYDDIESRRTGHRWAVGLSQELWNIIYAMWEHRNTILHQKEVSGQMHGFQAVKAACLRELQLGITDSMDDVYHHYLDTPVEDLMALRPMDLKNWLSIVRRAREATSYCYTDDMATDKALRTWVGLDE